MEKRREGDVDLGVEVADGLGRRRAALGGRVGEARGAVDQEEWRGTGDARALDGLGRASDGL